jgi:membrane associated rhomboid family serine protease
MLLPAGHDRPLRRLPIFALALVAICALVQIEQCSRAPSLAEVRSAEEGVHFVEQKIVNHYYASLKVGVGVPVAGDVIDDFAPWPAFERADGTPERSARVILEQFRAGKVAPPWHHFRGELEVAEAALAKLSHQELVERFGFVPAQGASTRALTYAFVHRGGLELAWGMLFLWLAGICLEDRWGHAAYAGLHLVAVLLGAIAYGAIAPASLAPLVGSACAVAAAMGALSVSLARARLKLLYWAWWRGSLFKAEVTYVPAIFALPVWLAGQGVLLALLPATAPRGGTAASTLVGLSFGAAVAGLLRASGLDARLAPTPLDSDEADEADEPGRRDDGAPALASASAAREASAAPVEVSLDDPAAAIAALRAILAKRPDHANARRQLLSAGLSCGDLPAIAMSASPVITRHGESAEWEEVVRLFVAIEQKAPRTTLTDRALAMVTRAGVRAGDAPTALRAARRLVDAYPSSPLLRGTLWDVGALQEKSGLAALSAETLRRIQLQRPGDR